MNMIDSIAELKALRISKDIDENMRKLGITELDKNKYQLDIYKDSNGVDKYTVYEKVLVGKFYVDTN